MHFIARYLGVQRAIRNLDLKYNISPVFQIWTFMPSFIMEEFGNVFYQANEWDELERCELDAVPKCYYYNEIVKKAEQFK